VNQTGPPINAALHTSFPREREGIGLACDKTRATLRAADQQAAGQRARITKTNENK
jgi:hypothetical protein